MFVDLGQLQSKIKWVSRIFGFVSGRNILKKLHSGAVSRLGLRILFCCGAEEHKPVVFCF